MKGHASLRPRGTPLREAACTEHEPTADPVLQPAPAFEFDQRLNWYKEPPPLARARRRAGSFLPPPACPHAPTLVPAPARKCHDKQAEQPLPPQIDA